MAGIACRRLLCDEMLAGLARWLRAAGHDVVLSPAGTPDALVIARARSEARVLVTCDRDFAPGPGVVALRADGIDRQAAALSAALGLDWLAAPFTRCLRDGAVLEPAAPDAVPDGARARGGPFHRCPACGRVYWPGSHVRRMRARLEGWAGAEKAG